MPAKKGHRYPVLWKFSEIVAKRELQQLAKDVGSPTIIMTPKSLGASQKRKYRELLRFHERNVREKFGIPLREALMSLTFGERIRLYIKIPDRRPIDLSSYTPKP